MEFKIISDVENKLFNRREIEGELISNSAPNREEVAKAVSKNIKVPEENIYSSFTEKEKIERKSKKEKAIEEKRKKALEEAAAAQQSSEVEEIPEQQTEENKIIEETKSEEKAE